MISDLRLRLSGAEFSGISLNCDNLDQVRRTKSSLRIHRAIAERRADSPIADLCPNMAIRSSVFQSGVRFNSFIGPSGSSYQQGRETELILRLARQRHRGWHVHRAVVEHFIREEQLRKAWVMKRVIRYGPGEYRLGHVDAVNSSKTLMGTPRYLVREMLRRDCPWLQQLYPLGPKPPFARIGALTFCASKRSRHVS